MGITEDPIPHQTSKAPVYQMELPFEFEVDPTTLKVNKLEKLFKRAQAMNSIPDIEDGYTDSTVTLPDRFKMSHIDRFDGSGDPIVHLRSNAATTGGTSTRPSDVSMATTTPKTAIPFAGTQLHKPQAIRPEARGSSPRFTCPYPKP
ncbi:hypothetical protein HYC85_030824 [Camellia sinensis]|uniref:Uncharacterized protein n=1 Tax=Camellia sinensis TaxID=4442 RepID=A0A7J7G1R6_CAMSI|nr:hypothetical protein HYC85_030824 [Camellia sinensis]